jgi:hypothetical protein
MTWGINLAGYLKIEKVPYVVDGISAIVFLKIIGIFFKSVEVK